jgi:transposase-like protein
MGKATKLSLKIRERAIRLVSEQAGQYESEWTAIKSVSEKIGCTAETLHSWIRQAECGQRNRDGLTTSERERLKQLEKEKRELKC